MLLRCKFLSIYTIYTNSYRCLIHLALSASYFALYSRDFVLGIFSSISLVLMRLRIYIYLNCLIHPKPRPCSIDHKNSFQLYGRVIIIRTENTGRRRCYAHARLLTALWLRAIFHYFISSFAYCVHVPHGLHVM